MDTGPPGFGWDSPFAAPGSGQRSPRPWVCGLSRRRQRNGIFHILAVQLLGEELLYASLHVLLGFIVAIVFATLWSRFFRRGPLEWLLGKATEVSKLVR
ncbi:DUF418 domain-containing protein [Streptomyces cupreus]|uniref:DUF418 domain-containing protein n=1 Tax=Streptomyces cupreus TaxID=2759956 RepID=UPI00300C7BF6